MEINRRDFLKLAGFGGIVMASGVGRMGSWANAAGQNDFFFVQLSDTHWGFSGPQINPDSTGTLKKAVATVNSLQPQPDFIVFTGDLTHVTDDDKDRRTRMSQFREIISQLKVKDIKFLPGEHDAGLDEGEAFQEFFGKTHYAFDHKGVHFIALDNVSDPTSVIGDKQLEWVSADLKGRDKDAPIVVFTHRPLFDLYPDWDWFTRDGNKVLEMFKPFSQVTVFNGHIHQENHQKIGNIFHHAARGLMFPLPAPGSVPKKAPIPWDPAQPYKGLGFRRAEVKIKPAEITLTEFGVQGG